MFISPVKSMTLLIQLKHFIITKFQEPLHSSFDINIFSLIHIFRNPFASLLVQHTMAPLISNAVQHLITRADEESNFKYEPNKNAALAAAALFGISSVWHLWVMFKNKTWVYTALVVGAFSKTPFLWSNTP